MIHLMEGDIMHLIEGGHDPSDGEEGDMMHLMKGRGKGYNIHYHLMEDELQQSYDTSI